MSALNDLINDFKNSNSKGMGNKRISNNYYELKEFLESDELYRKLSVEVFSSKGNIYTQGSYNKNLSNDKPNGIEKNDIDILFQMPIFSPSFEEMNGWPNLKLNPRANISTAIDNFQGNISEELMFLQKGKIFRAIETKFSNKFWFERGNKVLKIYSTSFKDKTNGYYMELAICTGFKLAIKNPDELPIHKEKKLFNKLIEQNLLEWKSNNNRVLIVIGTKILTGNNEYTYNFSKINKELLTYYNLKFNNHFLEYIRTFKLLKKWIEQQNEHNFKISSFHIESLICNLVFYSNNSSLNLFNESPNNNNVILMSESIIDLLKNNEKLYEANGIFSLYRNIKKETLINEFSFINKKIKELELV